MFSKPKQPTVNYALDSLGGLDGDMFGGASKPQQSNQTVELTPSPELDSERF